LNAVLQAIIGRRSFVHDLMSTASLIGARHAATPAGILAAKAALALEEEKAQAAAAAAAWKAENPRADASMDSDSDDESEASSDSSALPASSPLSSTFYGCLVSLARQLTLSGHGLIDAAKLKDRIGERYASFAGAQQQDAHEFLSSCFTHIEDKLTE
jgi:hypothetical protein